MKTVKSILRVSLAGILLLIMHSCLEYRVTTTVNPDGSIDRVIQIFRSDSGAFDTGSMFLPTSEGWEITEEWVSIQETEDDTTEKYVLTASRHFTNYQELNDELNSGNPANGFIQIETNLEKKFRWFYTEFRYSEIYKKHFPFDYFSVHDFLSEKEFMISVKPEDYIYSREKDVYVKKDELGELPVLSAEDSLRAAEIEKGLEEKFQKWMAKNAWEEFRNILEEGILSLDNEIQNTYIREKENIYDISGFEDMISPSKSDFSIEYVFSSIAGILETEGEILYHSNPERFDLFFQSLEKMYDPATDSFMNTIIMPGKFLDSNAEMIEGNECIWHIQFSEFFAEDFEMYAESRFIHSKNITYSILGFAIFIIFILSLSIKRRKK
jgi:hypothetical protein